jgi:hypothetical protein
MRKVFVTLVVIACIGIGCSDNNKVISPEQKLRETMQSKQAAKAYADAIKLANINNASGFLKLYEMATNDSVYTVEYSEVAEEQIFLLLYSKTELWIKTFSKIDQSKMKNFIKGIEVSKLPKGVSSDDQFKEAIFRNLEKMKGDQNELELIEYILGLYGRKRQ